MNHNSSNLQPEEIRKKLIEATNLSEKDLNSIIYPFWCVDIYNYLLSMPEYLDMLIKYLADNTGEFRRYDFYNYLFKHVTSGFTPNEVAALQSLAVILELMQINSIEQKDFDEILKQLQTVFQFNTNEFNKKIQSVFISLSEDNKTKGFKHHSIQEFLASLQIQAKDNSISYFKKLALIEIDGKKYLKPSWSHVIRFLLDSCKGELFQEYIIKLFNENNDLIDENLAYAMTNINNVGKNKEKFFEIIFYTYQRKRQWLPIWVRTSLWKFVNSDQLRKLKDEVDEKVESDTALFVIRGNIITLLDSILENIPTLISEEDKEYWKARLIEFANSKGISGVVQRESLSALKYYKDPSIIGKVKQAFEIGDKLTKEEFIDLCSYTDPESQTTIDYIAEGFKKGVAIHARYAIYKIKTNEGLTNLINKFISDNKFLNEFLDDESIFSGKGEQGDKQIIEVIKKFSGDTSILKLLKELIKTAFKEESLWNATKSIFLKQIAEIIFEQDSNYPFEILNEIKNISEDIYHSIYDLQSILAYLLTVNNIKDFFKEFKEMTPDKVWIFGHIVFTTKTERGEKGKEIYEYALKEGLVSPPNGKDEKEIEENEREIYKNFANYLEPEKGKYNPHVFEYFNNNETIIRKYDKGDGISRLKDLVINTGLSKLDSEKIEVNIHKSPDGKRTSESDITSYSSFFGDVLRTAVKLCSNEEILKYRRNIIGFVPFAYNDDLNTIFEIINTVDKSDLEYLADIYLNKESDKRYYLPSAYIIFVNEYLEKGIKDNSIFEVLKSFVDDESLEYYIRIDALEKLYKFFSAEIDKKWLENLFTQYSSSTDDLLKLAERANYILIAEFNDNSSINWLLSELKNRARPFKTRVEMHEVSGFENELDEMPFAVSITKINNDQAFNQLLNLLEEMQVLQDNNNDYSSYADYIWKIITAYIKSKPLDKAIHLISDTKNFLQSSIHRNTNWLLSSLDSISDSFKVQLAVPASYEHAINLVVKNTN